MSSSHRSVIAVSESLLSRRARLFVGTGLKSCLAGLTKSFFLFMFLPLLGPLAQVVPDKGYSILRPEELQEYIAQIPEDRVAGGTAAAEAASS